MTCNDANRNSAVCLLTTQEGVCSLQRFAQTQPVEIEGGLTQVRHPRHQDSMPLAQRPSSSASGCFLTSGEFLREATAEGPCGPEQPDSADDGEEFGEERAGAGAGLQGWLVGLLHI
jgi:hypothetical protein